MFVQALGFGIAYGAIVALAAVGFTVQFAISNVVNIAYGAILTVGTFLGYALASTGMDVWVAAAISGVATGAISAVVNRVVLRPLQRRGVSLVRLIIATAEISNIVAYVLVMVVSPSSHSYGILFGSTVTVSGMVFTEAQLIIIGAAAALMLGFHLLLTRTQFGRAMRATSANAVVARACGIRVDRIADVTWVITGWLCGVAGVALAVTTVAFNFDLGTNFLIYVLAAAILGGVGQPYGAMLGGLVVGIASQLAAAYTSPAYQDVAAFAILVLVLLVSPEGLMPSRAGTVRKLIGV